MRALGVLIVICIHYSPSEKHRKGPFLTLLALHIESWAPKRTVFIGAGDEDGGRRGEMVGWKNSQNPHFIFHTKCLFSLPALLFIHISGSN